MTASMDRIRAWAQSHSLWYYSITGGCCADEVFSSQACKYDLERFGSLPQSQPEQADLLIVSTVVTEKVAPEIKKIYDAMPTPKYVLALGACACSGGAFSPQVSYAVKPNLASVIPVDVYVPGCPPRPEAIMNGLILLQEKIRGFENARSKAE
jgi:NADH-quinone oxidoreductase subunit B